jgi:hypothetical protein
MEMRGEEGKVCRAEHRGASLADIAKREGESNYFCYVLSLCHVNSSATAVD